MWGDIVIGLIAVAVTAPIALRAFRRIRSGRHPWDEGTGFLPPPSGPGL